MLGVPAAALALPNELLKVWINDAYIRDKSPGEHVQFQLSPIGNPIGLIGNTLGAIPVGIDSTVAGFTTPANRPLGTQPSGPYGVGGPNPNQTPTLDAARAGAPELTVVKDEPTTTDDTKLVKNKDQGNVIEIEDETTDGNETPDATKPDPFAKLRESLKFDPNKGPFGIRPNGEGPLKRIVNALTGQQPKPKPEAAEPAKDEAPAA